MKCPSQEWLKGMTLLFLSSSVLSVAFPNSTHLEMMLGKYLDEDGEWLASKQRGRRSIPESGRQAIVDLHNKLRGQVYPPASNMEYMVWDSKLERTAGAWAEACLWEHGPEALLPHIGQNLGVHWGWYRPPTSHVQSWYNEVRYYSYPYPEECNPHCPFRCSAPICTHYTQIGLNGVTPP